MGSASTPAEPGAIERPRREGAEAADFDVQDLCGRYVYTSPRRTYVIVAALLVAIVGCVAYIMIRGGHGPGVASAAEFACGAPIVALQLIVTLVAHPFTEISAGGLRLRRTLVTKEVPWSRVKRIKVGALGETSSVSFGRLWTRPLLGVPLDVAQDLEVLLRRRRR